MHSTEQTNINMKIAETFLFARKFKALFCNRFFDVVAVCAFFCANVMTGDQNHKIACKFSIKKFTN